MPDFNDVMGAMYKEKARIVEVEMQKEAKHEEIFGGSGTRLTCDEILEAFKSGGVILDVRNPVDYISGGRVFNSINVPETNVSRWILDNKDVTKNTPILLYCDDGSLAQTAMNDLMTLQYSNVTNIGSHKWYPMCS